MALVMLLSPAVISASGRFSGKVSASVIDRTKNHRLTLLMTVNA